MPLLPPSQFHLRKGVMIRRHIHAATLLSEYSSLSVALVRKKISCLMPKCLNRNAHFTICIKGWEWRCEGGGHDDDERLSPIAGYTLPKRSYPVALLEGGVSSTHIHVRWVKRAGGKRAQESRQLVLIYSSRPVLVGAWETGNTKHRLTEVRVLKRRINRTGCHCCLDRLLPLSTRKWLQSATFKFFLPISRIKS